MLQPIHQRGLNAICDGNVGIVRSGPFAGMSMLRHTTGSGICAKLLGVYEAQLAPWIESLIADNPQVVVNIGCGDGYYLVGIARRLPHARCIGYDISEKSQSEATHIASINGVKNVEVRGAATAAALQIDIEPGTLLIVDIEGGELALLDPDQIPALRKTTLLIELHDYIVPETSNELLERFRGSHAAEFADQQLHLKGFDNWSEIERFALVCENRDQAQRWLLLRPLNDAAS